ncbi:sigma-70 family RNA polymerase sigma factor [Kitasatospora sp. NPDC052896]|uniref:sigma-70 family RNA polymerase sigma factor n=1 Tax=Kitasatospora sp. NPDC052896 TaxID=3364061 RepID=UPI0037C9536C
MDDRGEALPGGALRLTFDAFCQTHERAWTGYARTQVGSVQDAARVVEATKGHLARNWPLVLRQEIPAAYAWRLLKEHVAAWITAFGRPSALAETAAFDYVVSRFGGRTDESLRTLPEQIGLCTAISELPERQHDMVVLKYLLDTDDQEIADYLGMSTATMRSHLRQARRRLAKALGRLPEQEDGE